MTRGPWPVGRGPDFAQGLRRGEGEAAACEKALGNTVWTYSVESWGESPFDKLRAKAQVLVNISLRESM